ncbi:MAG: CHAT domain-containing tetratricopeptide repeat protein [Bacteroidales bacterium]
MLLYKLNGNIELYEKNYDQAQKFYGRSLAIEGLRDNPSQSTFASLNQNIGITLYYKNEFDSARYYLGESLKIKEQILNKSDPKLAAGNANFGLFLLYMGEPYEALNYMNRAEELYIEMYGHDYYGLAPIYNNKGSLLSSLSNFEEALNYTLLAFELYKNNLENDNRLLYSLHWNLGVLYNSLEKYNEAIDHFLKSGENDNDPVTSLQINRRLALCYQNLEEYDLAESYNLAAIRDLENLSDDFNFEKALSYSTYGRYCDLVGSHAKAIYYFQKAYDIFIAIYSHNSRIVSEILSDFSSHYFSVGDYENAIRFSQKGLIAVISDFNDTNYRANPSLDLFEDNLDIYISLVLKSRALYNYYTKSSMDILDLKACFETAELGIALFERIKSSIGADKTKLRMTEEASSLYDIAVLSSVELYEKTGEFTYFLKSFEYSEKSKASVLLATVRQMEALEIGSLPIEVRENEKKLKSQIIQYENLINDENQKSPIDSVKIARVRKNLFRKKLAYDSLMVKLETEYPNYYDLKYNLDVTSPSDIQKNLKQREAFIEYKLVDSVLFTYIITQDSSIVIKNIVGIGFSDKVLAFVSTMNKLPEMDNVKESSKSFAELGFYIFEKLTLNHPLIKKQKSLIIIPDDVLGYLSFDALISEFPVAETNGYRNLHFFIKDHSITYGYSGTLLFKKYKKRSNNKRLLAIAPTYESISDMDVPGMQNIRNLSNYLIPLQHSLKEVEQIHETFNGKIMIGEFATESNFKANSNKFDLLHFAMHTLINDEDPLNSKLVFSLNGDTIDDGFLNTYEIYNLNLSAELAVLSACKTGVGNISKGEGIMSLARGFLYAGVPGIVMTLWAIEDISSAEIITSFYNNLKRGESKNVALQKAKLNYLENANQLQSHPYFWAAYVQIGENAPLSKSSYLYYYLTGGILLLVLLSFLIIRRKKKSF